MIDRSGRRAVVLGGSLAGLLAARVLSGHFDSVTLVERDRIGDRPESRKGQPHTRHGHGLLAKGLEILTRLFPELPEDLRAGGAVFGDIGQRIRWHAQGGYRVPFDSGLIGVLAGRPFLESLVRRRLLSRANISVLDECDVERPVLSADGGRITGVVVRRRNEADRQEVLPADLVVDATGRGSATPRWLEALGFPRPAESVVSIGMKYATRTFRRRPGDLPGADMLIVSEQAPTIPRSGFVLAMEEDRWMVTLTARGSEPSPRTDREFLAFARTLAAPDLDDLLQDLEPLTDIVHHTVPSNLRRRYETLSRFPEGFLVLGDAVCSFNPVYGQGMTSAALQASVLDDLLTEQGPERLSRGPKRYFQRIARVIDIPWQMALSEDVRFAGPDGRTARPGGLLAGYLDRMHRATHRDPVVYRAFLEVLNLLRPPGRLFAPEILWRVLRNGGRTTARRSVPVPARPAVPSAAASVFPRLSQVPGRRSILFSRKRGQRDLAATRRDAP
ncbi:MAG: NAD(P)/FAD-dependent oxidoreductase [Planctomycetaceae bacterium]